jgi:hypothetical protein
MEMNLVTIVNDSGLEKTKADFILEKFQDYFKIASEWELKAKSIIVTSPDQQADMAMARVGRLFLREKRIAIEKARKELKEQSIREGKAIEGIANVLKGLIEPIEDYLDKQENFMKYKIQAEEIEKRKEQARLAELAEIERIKKEKEEQERIKIENERLKQEAIERERLAEIERKKQDELLRAEKEKAEKARIERERLELEIEQKKQAEILAQRQKEENELKLKQAPDKIKILNYINSLVNIELPIIENPELKKVLVNFYDNFISQFNVVKEKLK